MKGLINMDRYGRIKEIIDNSKGIVTTKFLKEQKISNYYINKLINDDIIERTERGIYVKTDMFEDEFYILQQKYNNIVFSYSTAMYLLGKTEKLPDLIDITTYKGFNPHRLKNHIIVHYVNKDNLWVGAIKIKTPNGFEVISYNVERILCDLVKNKKTGIDKEQTNKFIKELFIKNKIDLNIAIEYSKKLGCEKKLRNIMEVFI